MQRVPGCSYTDSSMTFDPGQFACSTPVVEEMPFSQHRAFLVDNVMEENVQLYFMDADDLPHGPSMDNLNSADDHDFLASDTDSR